MNKKSLVSMVSDYYRLREENSEEYPGEVPGNLWDLRPGRWGLGLAATKRLLVVDDEEHLRRNYYHIFSREGYGVFMAGSAVGAKDILTREKIDLLFLDLNMAEVDGSVLFEVARTFHPEVKIVISSVYPVEEQMERVRDADAYYDKSDSRQVLLGLVAAMINPSA